MFSILFVNLRISAGFGENRSKQLACIIEANSNWTSWQILWWDDFLSVIKAKLINKRLFFFKITYRHSHFTVRVYKSEEFDACALLPYTLDFFGKNQSDAAL